MKMERLIGILSILLQREKVTALELIPIFTTQGTGGGISIMEGYRVDRTILTAPEMQAILAGLRSLDSVSGTRRYTQHFLLMKLGRCLIKAHHNIGAPVLLYRYD